MGWLSKLLGKAGGDVEPLVVVPIPPLVTLLQQQEAAKGSPLTEGRGFADIDSARAWEEWVRVRSQGTA